MSRSYHSKEQNSYLVKLSQNKTHKTLKNNKLQPNKSNKILIISIFLVSTYRHNKLTYLN